MTAGLLGVASCTHPGIAALQRATFVFTKPAPDAGILSGLQCPPEAFIDHTATPAHSLGLFDLDQGGSGVADREEQLRIFVTAGSLMAPVHAYHSTWGKGTGVSGARDCFHEAGSTGSSRGSPGWSWRKSASPAEATGLPRFADAVACHKGNAEFLSQSICRLGHKQVTDTRNVPFIRPVNGMNALAVGLTGGAGALPWGQHTTRRAAGWDR